MKKFLVGLLLVVIVAGLGFGAFLFVRRYVGTQTHVERMVRTMSEVQTARVKIRLTRVPQSETPGFVFGDMEIAGVVDLRPAEGALYDLSFDVATTPSGGGARARVEVRRVGGRPFVRMVEGPPVLEDTLSRLGLSLNRWVPIESFAQALELLGESHLTPSALAVPLPTLRGRAAATKWFLDPRATLTEIVHGRVTRLFTSELDPDGIAAFIPLPRAVLEGARVNLWIDQSSYELRRIIVQFANGNQLDAEFEELNGEVQILSPEELPESDEIGGVPAPRLEGEPEPDSEPVSNDDRDGDGLTDDLEGFYRSNADHPDTDGDGYLDGDEVRNGYNPTGPGTLFNFGLPTL